MGEPSGEPSRIAEPGHQDQDRAAASGVRLGSESDHEIDGISRRPKPFDNRSRLDGELHPAIREPAARGVDHRGGPARGKGCDIGGRRGRPEEPSHGP